MDIRLIVPLSWKERLQNLSRDPVALASHPLQDKVMYPWYWYTPGTFRGSYGLSMWISIRAQCGSQINKFSPQYLLSSWAYPEGTAGSIIADKLGIPAFVKVHGSDITVTGQHPSVRRQINTWGKQITSVAAVSADLGKKLQEIGIPKFRIKVIYNGIDHQRFHLLSRQQARKQLGLNGSRIILYVGNLKKEKGCMDLLESFVQLAATTQSLKLYFAGTGPMLKPMKKKCLQTELQDQVQFLGKVQHAALNQWYNAADLVCLPSYNEGVPNVLLEAMACGTPVVASEVGGVPEIITSNTGLLIQRGDTQGLQESLSAALDKSWNRDMINEHAYQFSWETNIQQMLDMFGCADSSEMKL